MYIIYIYILHVYIYIYFCKLISIISELIIFPNNEGIYVCAHCINRIFLAFITVNTYFATIVHYIFHTK